MILLGFALFELAAHRVLSKALPMIEGNLMFNQTLRVGNEVS